MPQPVVVADRLDQVVERDLAGEVDPLHRFVQHQQVGLAGDGAGQQRALELTAGQVLHLGTARWRMPVASSAASISRPRSGAVSVIRRSTVSGMVQSIASFCGT